MSKKMKLFKVSFIGFMLLLTGGLLAARSNADVSDPNLGIVEKVIKLQFNGPDKR
ncbi:hypothetical protein [Sporosarcina sp. SAFN-010]|uniref:hypothetical protein n=1 Tax=Sporosarcina sp. SAFN-010 TaxID=3387273 RepID=UPI003F7DE0A7